MSASSGEGTSSQASCEIACENRCRDLRIEWFQTETHIVIAVNLTNINADEVTVSFNKSEIFLKMNFKNASIYEKTIHLLHDIEHEECSFKVLSSKLEIKLPKRDRINWSSLEQEVKEITPQIEDEDLEEEEEGDDTLETFFQKIFDKGSDDVKKAMIKSYTESKGTVVNTNWDVVSKGKVSVEPPEGMEKMFDDK